MRRYETTQAKKDPKYVEPTVENVYAALRAEIDDAKAEGKPTWISAFSVEYRLSHATDADKVRRLLNHMAQANQGQPGSVVKWDWSSQVDGPVTWGRAREQFFSLLSEAKSAREMRLEKANDISAGQTVIIKGKDVYGGSQICKVLEGTDDNGDVTILLTIQKRVYSGDLEVWE